MKRLLRSKKDRIISGVLGGVGEFYHIDPTVIRLAYAVVLVLTGFFPLIILYIMAAIIIPEANV